MKILETIFLLVLVAIIMAAGNTVGYKVDFIISLQALGILVVISIVGLLISKIPGLKKLPVILWVSVVAAVASSPIFPYHEIIVSVSLAVFSGTFIFAALIAQITLHWEGVI